MNLIIELFVSYHIINCAHRILRATASVKAANKIDRKDKYWLPIDTCIHHYLTSSQSFN